MIFCVRVFDWNWTEFRRNAYISLLTVWRGSFWLVDAMSFCCAAIGPRSESDGNELTWYNMERKESTLFVMSEIALTFTHSFLYDATSSGRNLIFTDVFLSSNILSLLLWQINIVCFYAKDVNFIFVHFLHKQFLERWFELFVKYLIYSKL